jgi:SH3-like domain-containing protein
MVPQNTIIVKKISFIALFICTLLLSKAAWSINLESRDYFASIKAGKANIRSGPGTNYRIKFTYNMRSIPVRVISKYDNWNEIEDYDGERGWISQSLLSRKRTIIIKTTKSFVNVYSAATNKSRILIKLKDKVIAKLIGCKADWCKIQVSGKKGWLKKENFFGAYANSKK